MKSTIVSRTVLLALLAAGLAAPAFADDDEIIRSISVVGQGEAYGPPDRATINAGVQVLAPTVIEASRENQASIERIMQALKNEGIDAADVQTADYSVWPEQEHDPRGMDQLRITGYRVNNTVRVTVRNIDRLGQVLAAVMNAGANAIHGIAFDVEDTAALEQRARAAAMAEARTRAEALAELAGVKLGRVLQVSLSPDGGYPTPIMGMARSRMEAMAAPVPGISAGQLSVAVQVQVVFEIED